jgi:hypothetical protein
LTVENSIWSNLLSQKLNITLPTENKKLKEGVSEMKKVLASLLVLFVMMVGIPLSAEAHASCPRHRKAKRSYASRNYRSAYPRYRTTSYSPRYRSTAYSPRYGTAAYTYKRPSFYRRHRNLINLGIATGGGALIGGIANGRRGAGIGALIGAGSGALYTYVLNKKKRRY